MAPLNFPVGCNWNVPFVVVVRLVLLVVVVVVVVSVVVVVVGKKVVVGKSVVVVGVKVGGKGFEVDEDVVVEDVSEDEEEDGFPQEP